MDSKTIEILNGELASHFKPGPGKAKYRYVKGEDVISRLNLAFAHSWSSKVEQVYENGNQIIVLVAVEAQGSVHHGFGGAEIAVYKDGPRKGQPVDMSNTYKSAFTNALKKAAEQFGVGLLSEDNYDFEDEPVTPYTAPVPTRPVVTHKAPPAPSVAPAGPVSGSATLATGSVPKVPSVDELLKNPEVNKLLNSVDFAALASQLTNPVETTSKAIPVKAPSNHGYDPNSARTPDAPSPFPPSGGGEEKINDIQLNALGGLAKMKKVTPEQAIKMSLANSTKTSYAELTRNEAKDVIKALNRLDG